MKKDWLHYLKANGSSLTRLLKTIVLVGMMGAGKTAVGLQLAKMLDVSFLDSDDEIMNAAQRSIAEIFERDGEQFFRLCAPFGCGASLCFINWRWSLYV